MFLMFAVLSGLLLSATCMVLHRTQSPILLGLQYDANPNYNFAYEINDAHTGDIKSQQESRRGDTVLGQYSLLQPDGIRRTVDYRADDHTGFLATVNNDGRSVPTTHAGPASNGDVTRYSNLAGQNYQAYPTPSAQSYEAYPTPSAQSYQAYPTPSVQSYQAYPTPSAQSYQAYPTPSSQSYQAYPTPSAQSYQAYPTPSAHSYQAWPTPSAQPSPAPTSVAISRSSITQTFSHGAAAHSAHNPWP